MKIIKILAIAVLSVGLYSCGCEDVDLGKLEFTNELITYLPVQQVEGNSYYITIDNIDQKMNYVNASGTTTVVVPVSKINYSGKLDLNSCEEFYTADQKVYTSQIEGENPINITITYRKDVDTDGYNNIVNKDDVGDMIEFRIGYNNKFNEPIQSGDSSKSNYITNRAFFFYDATTSTFENYAYKQEFIPTITLNGVQHDNVYHLVLGEYFHHLPEDWHISNLYPALDAVKGIYVKEGLGIIQAYTYTGHKIDISLN